MSLNLCCALFSPFSLRPYPLLSPSLIALTFKLNLCYNKIMGIEQLLISTNYQGVFPTFIF
jgi:hypothetical protein